MNFVAKNEICVEMLKINEVQLLKQHMLKNDQ